MNFDWTIRPDTLIALLVAVGAGYVYLRKLHNENKTELNEIKRSLASNEAMLAIGAAHFTHIDKCTDSLKLTTAQLAASLVSIDKTVAVFIERVDYLTDTIRKKKR
jgi:hypothetical protein